MKYLVRINIRNEDTGEEDSYAIPKTYFWDENNTFGQLAGRLMNGQWRVDVKLYDGSIKNPLERQIFKKDYLVNDSVQDMLLIMRDIQQAELDYEASQMAEQFYGYQSQYTDSDDPQVEDFWGDVVRTQDSINGGRDDDR